MAIRIDPALNWLPRDTQRQFEHEISRGRGPISDAVMPLNSELLRRQEQIDLHCRHIDALHAHIRRLTAPAYALDALDEFDLCDAWAGLPVEWFNHGGAW